MAGLPSVESLEGLRRRAQPTANRKPVIGFANPLPSPTFVAPKDAKPTSAVPLMFRGTRVSRGLPATIGETRDVSALRRFLAGHILESSEAELIEVAQLVGADPNDLYVGSRATETALKNAKLSSYRIVYFATHGYIAGTFSKSEPSLALTVPDQPNDFDDGLLTASEIALLPLDADWVVLSACDTASGEGKGAEGLSGLARAFFHAGARALLVSNFSLDDISAKEIMKQTFLALQQDQNLKKSEALRRAMLNQISRASSKDRQWDSYPGRWAAFEVIGTD